MGGLPRCLASSSLCPDSHYIKEHNGKGDIQPVASAHFRQDVGKTFRADFGVGLEVKIFPLIPKTFRVDTRTYPTKRVLSSDKGLSLPIAAIFQPNNEFQTRNLKNRLVNSLIGRH